MILALANIAILRADNSGQYQLCSQTGVRSACHSLRPQTRFVQYNAVIWYTLHYILGIHEAEIIRENIAHYVESELFKDREPPLKSNARFYPSQKMIYNHSLAKLGIKGKGQVRGRPKSGKTPTTGEQRKQIVREKTQVVGPR